MNNVTPIQAAIDKQLEKPKLTEQEAMTQALSWAKDEGIDIGDDLAKQLIVENKAREFLGVPAVVPDPNWRAKLPGDAPAGFLDDCLGVVSIHLLRKKDATAVVISDSSGCQGANGNVVAHRVAWLMHAHFDTVVEMATNLMQQGLQPPQAADPSPPTGLVGPDGLPLQ